MKLRLELPAYTPAQEEIFVKSSARRRLVQKGRRFGFTNGAAIYCIESMLAGKYEKVLWGDTTLLNVRNYAERLFLPHLGRLPSSVWKWYITDKKLRIGSSVLDFRAAETPENWEGFGYDLVILNEAGIILKNRYLWENAVSPMLLDNPEAVAIIGGTPKGKNLFYELCAQAENNPRWARFRYTTFDNPALSRAAVEELIRELGGDGDVVRQEIYGEFVDISTFELIGLDAVLRAMQTPADSDGGREVWGVDVARHGADSSVIARRRGKVIHRLDKLRIPDTCELAARLADLYHIAEKKPEMIFIEANGLGWGVYDAARKLNLPVFPADTSVRSSVPKVRNKRAEMYRALKEWIEKGGGALPKDERLKASLTAVEYTIDEDGMFKLMPKESVKQKTGFSPDEADACALTFAYPLAPKVSPQDPIPMPENAW